MKDQFFGYTKKSLKEIKNIWNNSIICMDANVLLNLYRYSDDTRKSFLDIILKLKDQIGIPHQAALEFHKNRFEVIANQEKIHSDFIDKIEMFNSDLQSKIKPPFLSKKLREELEKSFKNLKLEINLSITHYKNYLNKDDVYDEISGIIGDKIEVGFNNEEKEKIFSEGEKRYKMKVPPGFEDEKKKDGIEKYGDLLLWKQIIEISKKYNQNIVLITDEKKVDWWWKLKDGRVIGPRQELVEELQRNALHDFCMYSSERFLEYSNDYLQEKMSLNAFNEMKELKEQDFTDLELKMNISATIQNVQNEMEVKLSYINNRLLEIDNYIDLFTDNPITGCI